MTIQGLSRSPAETREWGRILGARLAGDEIVLIHGDLGAGKTRFAKGLFAGLGGHPEEIVSPTFTLMNRHEINGGRWFLHYDLYRLEGLSAGRMPEIDDNLGEAVQVVEWAQFLDLQYGQLDNSVFVRIDFVEDGDDLRRIRIHSRRLEGDQLARALRAAGIEADPSSTTKRSGYPR